MKMATMNSDGRTEYTRGAILVWLFLVLITVIVAILHLAGLYIVNETTGGLSRNLANPVYSPLECIRIIVCFLLLLVSSMIVLPMVACLLYRAIKEPSTKANQCEGDNDYGKPPEAPPQD